MTKEPSELEINLPTHYVGIGASAGGLEALQEFFSNLPSDTGAAYIVVQHLSPDFKSMMPELLSKNTSMRILQVTDGILVEPDCIYLMPARKNMLFGGGRLLISDQIPEKGLQLPIDVFLRSLGEDQQHKAIGIVLSGTGSDGSRGIKVLKETGGLVIIQEPGSAKFDGMPISAYNTGLADILLPPKEMGQHLVNFINHPLIAGNDTGLKYTLHGNDGTLSEIFQMLKDQSSINFAQYKASTVARRIERRLSINQLTSLEAYLKLLIDSPREIQILSKELLIGVTRFFRDDSAYDRIINDIIPKILNKTMRERDGVRIWVAGCSSGEEAYSMAILVDEALKEKNISCNVKVFATDVDEEAVAEASAGIYNLDIAHDMPADRINNYFIPHDNHYEIIPRIRQTVIFAAHNMIEDPPFSNIDMVTCRNVLIYFQHIAQKKVLSSLYFALNKEGFLFLGSSESLGDLQNHFETVDERHRVFRKISNLRVPIGSTPPTKDGTNNARINRAMAPVPPSIKASRLIGKPTLSGVLERLVHEYAPDCIILNDVFDAVHVYGDISNYIKGILPGKISNNIKDMVIDELAVAISTAIFRCEKNEEDIYYKDVIISSGDTQKTVVDLSIFIVKDSEHAASPRHYVVQFIKQISKDDDERSHKITFDVNEQSRQRIADLELELIKKQEHLQITIEELETTNEELQSANEELMSANEELQSTNEELQSVNEELYTVNSEYQEKICELTEANTDLDSVITATDMGIIFLDDQLAIRKFTQGALVHINVRQSDVGRPFHHISHDLNYDAMLSDIAKVSSEGIPIEQNIYNNQDQALLMRILPYRRDTESMQTGVLITITNISRLKFVESALQRAQAQLRNSLLDHSERLHKRVLVNSDVKVLLLDDDSVDRRRTKKMLDALGDRTFNVTACSEIDEAIEVISKNAMDICLVDYQLTGGTAKDFTEQARAEDIDTPIIVLSGYSEEGLDADFLNSEIFDFLKKDELSSQLLSRSIDYVLERRDVKEALDEVSA